MCFICWTDSFVNVFGTVQISGSALRLSKLDYPVPYIYLKMVVCVFHHSWLTLFTSSALLWRESTLLRLHPTCTFWGGLTFVYFLYWLNFHLPRTAILSLLLAGYHSLSVFCCRTHFSRYFFNMCMNVFLIIICKCTNKYVMFQVFLQLFLNYFSTSLFSGCCMFELFDTSSTITKMSCFSLRVCITLRTW